MKLPIYYLNAFTDKLFSGNPAAVCVLSEWLSDPTLTAIAKENNLPVTAFLLRDQENYQIRWITPEYELDICGHGTLAGAYVIFNYLETNRQTVNLQSRRELFSVSCSQELITLNFPVKNLEPCASEILERGLGLPSTEIYQHGNERYLVVYEREEDVKRLTPDMKILKKLIHRGVTVTAPASEVDFVSRTFYPQKSFSEDPATGASHCMLAPYWAKRLGKIELHAKQVSPRGGEMFCKLDGDRVLISGKAVGYMQGEISLENNAGGKS